MIQLLMNEYRAMKYSHVSKDIFILRFIKGEEIISALKKFAKEKGIHNATFVGLGSIENPTLAHYRVDTRKYSEKKLEGIYEVLSIVGNIGLFENEQLVHAHITLSDDDMRSFGGHVVRTTVSATLEITLFKHETRHSKKFSEEIGLKLWHLPEDVTV